jgi:FkbH-like protein
MKIELNSTSFLLPNNENWSHLKKDNEIIFSEYGNINNNENINNKIETEITLFFLPDLFDYFQNDKIHYKSQLKKVKNIIKLIKNKIKLTDKKFIIAVSEYLYNNVINFSKNINFSNKIKFFFIDELYNLSKKYNNLFVVDLDIIFSEYGYKNCLDQRNYYMFRCRLSTFGIEIISKNLKDLTDRIKFTNKKVLLVDCDNTLWGGVLAEDGIENIQIGQDGIGVAFSDFQKAIIKMKNSGILIVLVSKNERSDVEKVLKEHQSMILKKKDITTMKVNWNEKSINIKQLSDELSLGLNSFVFWDDNPIEREKVRAQLKDVEVIEPLSDVTSWPKQLLEYKGFSKSIISKEDGTKTKQYKIREKFEQDKHSSRDEINYLKSIKIKPTILKIDKSTINRTVQMCQKTNQFNLRTKKYDTSDILKLNNTNISFLVKLKDSYGDHGIVSFISLKIVNDKFIFIDTFLMSCRILGRYLEFWILNEIKKTAIKRKINHILLEYIPTKRNIVAKNFILKNKFETISKKEAVKYNIFIKKLKKESINSEFYSLSTNKIIPNLQIYEKNRR